MAGSIRLNFVYVQISCEYLATGLGIHMVVSQAVVCSSSSRHTVRGVTHHCGREHFTASLSISLCRAFMEIYLV